MNAYKTIILLFISLISIKGFPQSIYQSEQEELILSFKTQDGKMLSFCLNKVNQALIFRWGTAQKIDLFYPSNFDQQKLVFTYSFYLRGGGNANEGLDLNYIYFIKDDIKYILYETSHSGDMYSKMGLKLLNLKTSKITEFIAAEGTQKGTLIGLRDSELVMKGEELFD
jgi:hypothetical protein